MSSPEIPVIDYYSIYDVDVKEETCDKVELASHADGDLLKFLKKVAAKTRSSSSKRQASFILNSPVKVALEKVVNNDKRDINSEDIAKMLLEAEITVYSAKMDQGCQSECAIGAR